MPPPLGYDPVSGRWEHQLLPKFGRLSSSQSKWISLGGVAIEAGTEVPADFEFAFAGTDPNTGMVLKTDEVVDSLAAILITSHPLETPDPMTGCWTFGSSVPNGRTVRPACWP